MKLIFIGPPGAGKGTVAQKLIEERKIVQISTGDLLRDAVRKGTALGKEAKRYMEAGDLVPDDLVIHVLKERLAESDCINGFILDGFPRTLRQAEALEAAGIRVDRVVNFVVSDEIIVHRLSGRRVHRETGKIYNVNPDGIPQPPRDIPAEALYQRDDDKPEAIRNRLLVYRQQTEPLIRYYAQKNLLVTVNGDQDLEEIVDEVKRRVGI